MLNNYNTCMAIFSAFDNSAVGRLRRTWEVCKNIINLKKQATHIYTFSLLAIAQAKL